MKAVLIPVFGGLGNQMFQVAHALALSRNEDIAPSFVDFTAHLGRVNRQWELGCFNIPVRRLSIAMYASVSARVKLNALFGRFSPRLNFGVMSEKNFQISEAEGNSYSITWGYWQGERFFSDADALVRSVFRFPKAEDIASDLGMSEPTSVGVHVRRGDFVSDPVARNFHLVCDMNWYMSSMNAMRLLVPGARFFVFSDEPEWAQRSFCSVSDVTVVKSDACAAWVDMARLSRCSHFIISNSTYSWWASYLGRRPESITVAPKFWFRNVQTVSLPIVRDDWIIL